jgi:signal transduction histidine kinase
MTSADLTGLLSCTQSSLAIRRKVSVEISSVNTITGMWRCSVSLIFVATTSPSIPFGRLRKEEALALVTRLDETSTGMSGMLNTLLDINHLPTVGCSVSVHIDPRLLEQMLRKLLSNALRYRSSRENGGSAKTSCTAKTIVERSSGKIL